jgi:23S rRNA (uracil1939-C5)-methyltransferase
LERAVAERAVIDRLGHRGDGIAETADGPAYVPYALPGETVLLERDGARARLVAVEAPSPDRVEPFCPYFGTCGGCLAQHMGPAVYSSWKRGILDGALQKARIAAAIDPLIDAHGAGRRRVTFHARTKDGQTRVGYMAAGSHDLVEIAFCPISEPRLAGAPGAALALARVLERSRKPLDLQVTATETGLDIDIRGHGPVADKARLRLVEAAAELDLARLSVHGEVVVERRPPSVTMGKVRVVPPPGSFLQATAAGEAILSALVVDGCGGARRVADLFAGCGPFTLRLAETREVQAVDGDGAALAALNKAARNTPGLRPVKTDVRDLFRRPLLPPELARFDAVVMDPPRAGAEAQARQLAAAGVPAIVSVSCDAGTFARDAAILIAGGYRLERVVPVDQFKYSAHLELVGFFRSGRPGNKRSGPALIRNPNQ